MVARFGVSRRRRESITADRCHARKGAAMAGLLRSMTGFGQAQGELSPRLSAQVRVTSLNSRFLEVVLRTHPRIESAELEAALRPVLGERLVRGRVQVVIELRPVTREATGLALHWEVASSLLE